MQIVNTTKNTILAERVEIADTFFSRMRGLLGKKSLPEDAALVITRCRSIHMLFMRFPIDIVFVGPDDRAVGLVKGIRPFRLSPVFFRASFVIEGPEGMIGRSSTEIGDVLRMNSVSGFRKPA